MSNLAAIRTEYKLKSLNEDEVASDPIHQFSSWWQDAVDSEILEVNAMTLCTVTPDGRPNGRIVLLKGFSDRGFIFFTNYRSQKGNELTDNPFATLVFFWKELERQIRISGKVTQLPGHDSDDYFSTRPRGSQLSAWASPQSEIISDREVIEERLERYTQQFDNGDVTRPPHWGGYLVTPESIEFWQGRPSRMHDRLLYSKTGSGWKINRMAP